MTWEGVDICLKCTFSLLFHIHIVGCITFSIYPLIHPPIMTPHFNTMCSHDGGSVVKRPPILWVVYIWMDSGAQRFLQALHLYEHFHTHERQHLTVRGLLHRDFVLHDAHCMQPQNGSIQWSITNVISITKRLCTSFRIL